MYKTQLPFRNNTRILLYWSPSSSPCIREKRENREKACCYLAITRILVMVSQAMQKHHPEQRKGRKNSLCVKLYPNQQSNAMIETYVLLFFCVQSLTLFTFYSDISRMFLFLFIMKNQARGLVLNYHTLSDSVVTTEFCILMLSKVRLST